MECDILLLADSAQVAGDKFFILGGGWTELRVDTFPASHPIAVAVGVVMDQPRIARRCTFTLSIVAEGSGRTIVDTGGEFEVEGQAGPPGAPRRASMVFNVAPRFEAPGNYTVAFTLDGRPARKTSFTVAVRTPRQALAAARDGAVAE